MKKIILIACAAAWMAGCNNKTESATTGETGADSTTEKIDYAYLPVNHPPDNWLRGDPKNIALVLKGIKGWETGNIDQAMEPFADTVHWSFDGIDEKVPKDSLRVWLTDSWKNTSNIKVTMEDYEAVISKDKKDEWVTIWYKQVITDKAGKVDSASVIDDAKIVNGKIVVFDEKQRKYPKSRK